MTLQSLVVGADGVAQMVDMTADEEATFIALLQPSEQDYANAVQMQIDVVARARSYADGVACASYVTSTNTAWKAEADAFVAWRDAVWAYAFAELAAVQAGQIAQPTVAVLVAALPTITWPS